MRKRTLASAWAKSFERGFAAVTRQAVNAGTRAMGEALRPAIDKRKPPPGSGSWIAGIAVGATGARRYRLYRPPDVSFGERLPLMVMLHGCGQDAKSFAQSTRMNRIAARERFMVLYPEQDRLANAQGCWNWFDTRSGPRVWRSGTHHEGHRPGLPVVPVDRTRVAVAGLSAGASMAALLVTRHPGRFKAVMMHSGIPPGHGAFHAVGRRRDARAIAHARPLADDTP